MTLSFEHKLSIFEDDKYSMQKYSISYERINFRYKEKVIISEMHQEKKFPQLCLWLIICRVFTLSPGV